MRNENNQEIEVPKPQNMADVVIRISGEQLPVDFELLSSEAQQELLHELQKHENTLEWQDEELRRKEEQLDIERARYFDVYTMLPIGCLTVNVKGMIVEANSTAVCMLEVAHDRLLELSIPTFIHEDDQDIYRRQHRQLFGSHEPQIYELRMVKAGGEVFPVQLKTALSRDAEGVWVCHVIFTDITGRKKVEEERELVARLITQVNGAGDLRECMSDLTASLQSWSGCEAVGIRLRDGEDYPYFETRGFPQSFVEAENVLCAYEPDGKLIRDSTGNPVLECMCGNVLCGRFDPAQPFFTAQGSFWSNSTSDLLASATANGRLGRTRNRCNREGYESVALIPLRNDRRVLGLLQFNDHCPGCFTLENIRHFERIADMLALAISRRQAEAELRESEVKYRTVADYTYAMETWRKPDGTCQYVSPSCERVTGYTADAFLNDPKLIERIAYPEDQSKVVEHFFLNHLAGRKQNTGLDFRMLTPGGEIRWLSHSSTAVYDEQGQWSGRRGSFREITKGKLAEERLQFKEEKRQMQKAESLGRMAGAVAHHFNNKLHAIMGYLELAMANLPPDDTLHYNMASALEAADQAAEVSRLMLTYLGHVKGKREPFDLAEICQKNLPILQNSMPKRLKLEADLHVPGPVINTNVEQICQILQKTVANAYEAAPDDLGSIRLSVYAVSSCQISPLHRFPGNWQPGAASYACLEVRDNGCGLTENEIEEVFDPFYSTKFTGRGLGLPVVQGLVQAHGGVVTVESSPGLGSIFRAYFPLSAKYAGHNLEAVKKTEEIQREGVVLVVEDDKIVLEITSILLSNLGYTVLTAMDGIEAIDLFQRHKDEIQFVLSDFAMPRLNGLETFQALRKIVPDIKMILASGYSEEQVMDGNPQERPQLFLKKPYSRESLKEAIDRILARSSL